MGIASQFKSQKGIFLHRQLRAHPKSVLIMDFVKLWAGLFCQQCSGQHEHSRDNYIKWNLLIMEFTIWDSTLGCSVPLCVTLVFLNY